MTSGGAPPTAPSKGGEPRPGPAAESAVAAYRRAAARAGGCAARAPSLAALGLAWRLRADALALAAAYAHAHDGTTAGGAGRGRAGRLRQLARAWAAGATRLAQGDAQGPRWRAWLDDYLARSSAIPGEGAAWAAMRAEFVVWCLAQVVDPARPAGAPPQAKCLTVSPTTRRTAPGRAAPRAAT